MFYVAARDLFWKCMWNIIEICPFFDYGFLLRGFFIKQVKVLNMFSFDVPCMQSGSIVFISGNNQPAVNYLALKF